jgi:hypothetical protein
MIWLSGMAGVAVAPRRAAAAPSLYYQHHKAALLPKYN